MTKAALARIIASPWLSSLFRVILGAVFLYAGSTKVGDPDGFAQALYNYRILPGLLINPMAIVLPWIEVMVGLSLLSGILYVGGAFLATGLLSTFAVALGISMLRGLDIACGCFSTSGTGGSISWSYLLRDLFLLAMAVCVSLFDRGWSWVKFRATSPLRPGSR
jgi:uncharacterized membrane protein YphA (DoxX/SURF4 family)